MLISSKSCILLPSGFTPIRHQGAQDTEGSSTEKVHRSNTLNDQNGYQVDDNSLSSDQNSFGETINQTKDTLKNDDNQLCGSDKTVSDCSKIDNYQENHQSSQEGFDKDQNSNFVVNSCKADFVDSLAANQSVLTIQKSASLVTNKNTNSKACNTTPVEKYFWDEDIITHKKTKAEHPPKGISSFLPSILARWSGVVRSGVIYEGNTLSVTAPCISF